MLRSTILWNKTQLRMTLNFKLNIIIQYKLMNWFCSKHLRGYYEFLKSIYPWYFGSINILRYSYLFITVRLIWCIYILIVLKFIIWYILPQLHKKYGYSWLSVLYGQDQSIFYKTKDNFGMLSGYKSQGNKGLKIPSEQFYWVVSHYRFWELYVTYNYILYGIKHTVLELCINSWHQCWNNQLIKT